MSDLTLAGLCGSLRAGSYNRLLMAEAAARFAPTQFIDIDLRLPLFDDDLQQGAGIPPAVQLAADQIAAADAVIVVTPEYNKGISGVLKNALDWISRVDGNPWVDKPVAILSATAGRSGGERAQNMTRLCLSPFRPLLLTGPEVLVGGAAQNWDDSGTLTNDRYASAIDAQMAALRRYAGKP